jgi:hypothetical protein
VVRAPLLDRHNPRIDQLQAAEEAHDLIRPAHAVGGGAALVVIAERGVLPGIGIRGVVYREVTAGGQGSPERADDRLAARSSSSGLPMWPRMPISMIATGRLKSNLPLAMRCSASGSLRSASM